MQVIGRAAVVAVGSLIAAAFSPAPADEIYKSVDAQGHVVYSDRPISATAKKTDVTVQEANPAEAARLAKERELLKAEDDQRKKAQFIADRTKAQQEQLKKTKCQNARDRYNSMKETHRMFKTDADGNRVYYTDTEVDMLREEARQAMNTACGT